MIIVLYAVVGLILGSFINALVWRIYEQDKLASKKTKKAKKPPVSSLQSPVSSDLSILHGRSMCPHCNHTLSAWDLIPLISWLALKGKCRYCNHPIGLQYPLVELLTSVLFVVSYVFWPYGFGMQGMWLMGFWLVCLVGLIALMVYDLRWFLLPNRIVFPLIAVAGLQGLYLLAASLDLPNAALRLGLSVLIGGGIFYVLFQVSSGRWIGGGDVKLGVLLGLLLASPIASFMMLFGSSILGTFIAVPLLLTGRVTRKSHLPYGPFLIVATIIVQLFGQSLLTWYQNLLL